MDTMFTYGSLRRYIPFNLGLGMGVIGPSFYISLVIWDPIHLFYFFLLLNREINRFDCPSF